MQKIAFIFISLFTAIILGLFFLVCTHGFQSDGFVDIVIDSTETPNESNLQGKHFDVDEGSGFTITAITSLSGQPNLSSSEHLYRFHLTVNGRSKQWFSLKDRSMKQLLLVSEQRVEEQLRTVAALPDEAVTKISSGYLLP